MTEGGVSSSATSCENTSSDENTDEATGLVSLPKRGVEEVDVLEEKIADAIMFSGMVNHLSKIGGQTRTDKCRRVLRHCPTNQLAILSTEAVMKPSRCTAKDAELNCREWFRTASDRDGGREKRAAKKQQPSETSEATS